MKYIVDHDIHIHSKFSPCSNDARQTIRGLIYDINDTPDIEEQEAI